MTHSVQEDQASRSCTVITKKVSLADVCPRATRDDLEEGERPEAVAGRPGRTFAMLRSGALIMLRAGDELSEPALRRCSRTIAQRWAERGRGR